jgi:hypothetical protein
VLVGLCDDPQMTACRPKTIRAIAVGLTVLTLLVVVACGGGSSDGVEPSLPEQMLANDGIPDAECVATDNTNLRFDCKVPKNGAGHEYRATCGPLSWGGYDCGVTRIRGASG